MSNHLVVSHSQDLDGWTSGAVIRHILQLAGNNVECVGVDYDEIDPEGLKAQCEGKHVWLSDFCFGDEWMMALRGREFGNLSFTWIDHHKSAIERATEVGFADLPGFRAVKIKEGTVPAHGAIIHEVGDEEGNRPVAACELAWLFLKSFYRFDDPVPLVVKYLSKWDVWNKDEEWETTTLPIQHFCLSKNELNPVLDGSAEEWDHLLQIEWADDEWDRMKATGKAILGYQRSRNIVTAKRAYRAIWKGLTLMVINQGEINSGAFESLPKEDAMMCFKQNRTGEWTVSLYGHEGSELDLSKYAIEMGGGGHRLACGWQMKDINDLGLIREGEPGYQTESWNRENPTEAH